MTRKKRNIILIILGLFFLLFLLFLVFLSTKKTEEYVVTFDTDGGSLIDSIKVKKDEKIKIPEDPIKDGYIFDGWYLDDTLFDFSMKINKDITLKAHYLIRDKILRLSLSELSLKPGTSHTLIVENTTKQDIIWTSSNSDIASVNSAGKVTALKIGNTIITVMTKDGAFKATCNVAVTEDLVSVESVEIRGSSTVTIGKSIKLTADIKPANAANKAVTWKSSDTTIAKVDSFGNVQGLKAGKVKITVTTEDGSKTATKIITVTAKKNTTEVKNIQVKGVKIQGDNKVYVNETLQLTAVFNPNNATNKNVSWSSSDKKIASIDQNGVVTGINEGSVTITVTTKDGNYTDSLVITVSSSYSIVFTKKYNNYNVPVGYKLQVYKNKKSLNNFTSIIYKGNTKKFTDLFAAMGEIDEKESKASIKIGDEIIDNVPVSYQ